MSRGPVGLEPDLARTIDTRGAELRAQNRPGAAYLLNSPQMGLADRSRSSREIGKTVVGVPPAAQTGSLRRRASSANTRRVWAWPNGGVPPAANPVRIPHLLEGRSAGGSGPGTASSFLRSSIKSPGTSASTGSSPDDEHEGLDDRGDRTADRGSGVGGGLGSLRKLVDVEVEAHGSGGFQHTLGRRQAIPGSKLQPGGELDLFYDCRPIGEVEPLEVVLRRLPPRLTRRSDPTPCRGCRKEPGPCSNVPRAR